MEKNVEDLANEIARFRDDGDEIHLALDYNDDLRKSNALALALGELDIREAILDQHGCQGPPTRRPGKKALDGWFISNVLAPTRSGYLGYEEGLSDHRPVYLELKSQNVFGQSKASPKKFSGRRLKTDDPRVVKRYTDKYHTYLVKTGLYKRASELERKVYESEEFVIADQKEYEAIDKLRVKGMKWAERHCRKVKVGKVEWSPKLQAAMDTQRYWKLTLLRAQGQRISARRLIRLAKKIKLRHDRTLSLGEITELCAAAKKAYKKEKKKASSARGKWIDDLAVAKEEAGNGKAASHIKVMRQVERTRVANRTIKKAMKPNERMSLSILHEDTAQGTKTWTDKGDIEAAGLRENDRRFRQASDTPLQQHAAVTTFGPTGISAATDKILATGEVPEEIKALDPFLEDYLKAHQVGTIHLISAELSDAAHVQSWKKARESTSSGPSGVHFGHFIAGTSHAHIAAFEACMSGLPWITGYSPRRWRQGLNVMIPKEQGNFNAKKLRTILLYEADFNNGNKRLGRNLMFNAERYGLLAPEQYGSRKFYTAINQGLNKRLTFDILRQKKQRGALCSTDAMSCYDRITHLAASLALQRTGAPKNTVHCMLDTIQHLKHYIRTTYGDSVQYFQADDGTGNPIHGIGQGNGAGPTIWALVSTPIFDAMRRRGYGVFLQSAISGELIQFVGYAFVDDTDLAVTDPSVNYDEETSDIFDIIQESVRFWEGYIRCSGGAIRPDKSHWYLIDFEWKQGQWSYKQPQASDPPLVVRDSEGKDSVIERIPPNEGRRTVGVRLAIDGNNKDEKEYLASAAKTWCERVKSSRLPRSLVGMSFTTGIMRKLQFSLPATTFSKLECDELMSPLLDTALPCIGVNRHFPRALCFAPKALHGLAVPHLWVEQGIYHLQRVVECTALKSDITGRLIRQSLEQMHLEVGTESCPFSQPHGIWRSLATESWVTCVWDFTEENAIGVSSGSPAVPMLKSADRTMMEAFVQSGIKDPRVLGSLNRCRLFLRAARVSDVLTVCGNYIKQDLWDRMPAEVSSTNNFDWPRQGLPSKEDWQRWQDALQQVFSFRGPILKIQGGYGGFWTNSWKKWNWFLGKKQTVLAEVSHETGEVRWFSIEPQVGRQTRRSKIRSSRVVSARKPLSSLLQGEWRRVDVSTRDPQFYVVTAELETPEDFERNFLEELPQVPFTQYQCDQFREAIRWASQISFEEELENEEIEQLALDLSRDGITAVSDGSAKDGQGSAAWILLSAFGRISGGFRIPGEPTAQDSYRAELGGLLAILYAIRSLIRIFHLQEAHLNVACDGKGALLRLFANDKPARANDSQWDVVALAQQCLRGMPQASILWEHVYGHRDDNPNLVLTEMEQLNVLMDHRATIAREADLPEAILPGYEELWTVQAPQTIVHNFAASIRERCTRQTAEEYWLKKKKFDETVEVEDIDWKALGTAAKELEPTRHRALAKHAAHWCPCNEYMVRIKKATDTSCARCNKPIEDPEHVWKCQAQSARVVFEKHCEELDKWMRKRETCPEIAAIIRSRFRSWRANTRQETFRTTKYGIRAALEAQDKITWRAAFEGFWSTKWALAQERYYRHRGSQKSGYRWLVRLIRRIWEIAWDLWEDRNECNASRQKEAERIRLRDLIIDEYLAGFKKLHRSSRRLFSRISLFTRITHSTQRMQGWLLRVAAARARAALDPAGAEQDRKEFRDRQRRHNQEEYQRNLMVTWLRN